MSKQVETVARLSECDALTDETIKTLLGAIMTLDQAKQIVRQHQLNRGFATPRQALDDLCIHKSSIPIEQYVAVDRIYLGYSDYEHLLNK